MRLIDADKAITDYSKYGIFHPYDAYDLEDILNECQTVEAVPMSVIEDIKAEIKTEISDYEGCADFYEGIRFGLRTALEIIDKYKAESEEV